MSIRRIFQRPEKGKRYVEEFDTTNHPVEQVNWFDAADFCNRLSATEKRSQSYVQFENTTRSQEGTGYRLPTEAEWEFACRAGTTSKLWNGDYGPESKNVTWTSGWAGHQTRIVGELKPNPFGLFDVHGNVREWVEDGWEAGYYPALAETLSVDPKGPKQYLVQRVVKGGRWDGGIDECRSASRSNFPLGCRVHDIGFRVVLPIPSKGK